MSQFLLLSRIYAGVCGLLAVVSLLALFDKHVIDVGLISVLASISVWLGGTALSVLRRWRSAPWLAGISAALFCICGISLALLGWEDVGGARGAIPLGSVPVLIGLLGAFVAVGPGVRRGEAA